MWTCFIPHYLKLCTKPLLHWEWYPLKRTVLRRFYNRLRYFVNAQDLVSIRSGNVCTILLFLLFSLSYLPILLRALFGLFLLVTINIVYINSVRFKHIDSPWNLLELYCRGYNLCFLKLKQLIDVDIEPNPGPSQNEYKSPVGCPKKMKAFKGTVKKLILVKTMLILLVVQRCKTVLFNTIQPASLDIMNPWSVTFPSTLESLQKFKFEVNKY